MISLIEIFDQLKIDNLKECQFNAITIPDYENHRLAKDVHGNPALLLSVPSESKNLKIPNLKLHNVSVYYNANCIVKQNDEIVERIFTVISFMGRESSLRDYFLRLCFNLVSQLGNYPTHIDIRNELNYFIELFRLASQPQLKTFQGLWAELFLISEASDPIGLLNCWHSIPEEKYDFNNGEDRIEVKSTSNSFRIHNFSVEQLYPPTYATAVIVSVFVKQSSAGISIEELRLRIASSLAGQLESIEKMNLQIAIALGESISEIDKLKFDWHLAKDSIKFYSTDDIPKILLESIPDLVTDIRFKSDLTTTKSIPYSIVKEKGGIYSAI